MAHSAWEEGDDTAARQSRVPLRFTSTIAASVLLLLGAGGLVLFSSLITEGIHLEACILCELRLARSDSSVAVQMTEYLAVPADRSVLLTTALRSATLPSNTYSITVPKGWAPGKQVAVQTPRNGKVLLNVPPGLGVGSRFLVQIGAPNKLSLKVRKQQLTSLQKPLPKDLTSFSGMLAYERKLRQTMGKLKETWPTSRFMSPQGSMLAALLPQLTDGFYHIDEAADQEGFDPDYANGFHAGPPDYNNTNGAPGYTFVLNGGDLDVEDQGPGYYQPQDPEHWASYLQAIRSDCFAAPRQPWRDHANCAALVHRSHHYPNADPGRFSGAFGWNPPFPPAWNATNKPGAVPPDPTEYWNFGTDDDFASAASWDGKAYVPPPPPEEEEEGGEDGGEGVAEDTEEATAT